MALRGDGWSCTAHVHACMRREHNVRGAQCYWRVHMARRTHASSRKRYRLGHHAHAHAPTLICCARLLLRTKALRGDGRSCAVHVHACMRREHNMRGARCYWCGLLARRAKPLQRSPVLLKCLCAFSARSTMREQIASTSVSGVFPPR